MPLKLVAQVNPQKGYIITNDNDTVYGTIDYLTDARNVKACLFKKNGEQEYKSLSPSDIKGYRLAGDGIYYVSRRFTVDEKEELLFAEFLLHGGVSLYRYFYDYDNYFGFVDSDGKEVIIRVASAVMGRCIVFPCIYYDASVIKLIYWSHVKSRIQTS